MKKIILCGFSILAVLILTLTFTACGDGAGGGDDPGGGGDLEGWNLVPDYDWWTGKSAPYFISTPQELAGLAQIVNSGQGYNFTGQTITQTANIDLSGRLWTPIGIDGSSFNGRYNANGREITGLTIISNADYQGLFGFIGADGMVDSVILKGVSISGYAYVGGVAGANTRDIVNCSVQGSVKGANRVGGVAGVSNGANAKVDSCTFTGSVAGSGNWVGGVVGRNYGANAKVSCCSFTGGSVTSFGDFVGGVVGAADDNISSVTTFVEDCLATGSVTGAEYVGGVVGISYHIVDRCTFSGNVNGAKFVGGVVGGNGNSTVKNCSATGGSVTGLSEQVGGVVGRNAGANATVSFCFFSGSSVTGATNVGGVVGQNNGTNATVSGCYFSGSSVTGDSYAGGVVGYNNGGVNTTVQNCVALNTSISGSTDLGRVAGASTGTLANNYGRDPMTVGSNTVTGGALNNYYGANVSTSAPNGGYNTQGFWSAAPTSGPGFDFGTAGAWKWDNNLNLPALQ